MRARYSTLLTLSGAVTALAIALPACSKSEEPKTQQGQSTSPVQPAQSTTQTQQGQSAIVLEVMGSGEVYAIWSDPFGNVAGDHTTLPWSKSYTLPADENYVSLTWTSRDATNTGCRITVDGTVVVEELSGTTCVYTR
jgi:hypothetical protein